MEALQQLCRLHGDHHAGAIVNRARAEVPGIEMPGNDHHLLGMLGALEVGDHVITLYFRAQVRGKR